MNLNISEKSIEQAYTESALGIGKYDPKKLLNNPEELVVVCCNGEPVLAMQHKGFETGRVASNLINDKKLAVWFKSILSLDEIKLTATTMNSSDVIPAQATELYCVHPAKQGEIDSESKADLLAFMPNEKVEPSQLALMLCVTNSLMLILKPDAKPLQTNIYTQIS